MFIITLLFFLISGIIFIGLIKLLQILKDPDLSKAINYLGRFSYIVFAGIFIISLLGVILLIIEMSSSEVIFIMFIKLLIQTGFFIFIFIDLTALIDHLKNDRIFIDENIFLTQRMGKRLIHLTLTEIVIGFILGIFYFTQYGSFTLTTNPILILYIFIGLTLFITSILLKRAKTIYDESQLTI